VGGQFEPEGAAFADLAVDPDMAAVSLNGKLAEV
jgi:hypothetical protein